MNEWLRTSTLDIGTLDPLINVFFKDGEMREYKKLMDYDVYFFVKHIQKNYISNRQDEEDKVEKR